MLQTRPLLYSIGLLFLVLAPSSTWALAQDETVTVETILPAGSPIDDGLVLGPDGALYGSHWGLSGATGTTVSRVDLQDNSISTYVSGLVRANGLDFDSEGNLFVISYSEATVERVTPDGTRTTYATATSGNLSGLLIHPTTGVIYVTNYPNDTVGVAEANGTITPFLSGSGLDGPVGLAVDGMGHLYVSNFNDGKIFRVSDAGDLTEIADLSGPVDFTTGYITYAAGSLFATGIGAHIIQEVSLVDGQVRTLAGTGTAGSTDGPGATAQFNSPNGIVATPSGDTLYVSDSGTRAVRRLIRVRSTGSEYEERLAEADFLLSVAPNPFASHTAIRFQLSAPQHISLIVYDALGRRVANLVRGYREAGLHTVPFTPQNLAAGTYFARLQTRNNTFTVLLTLTP